MTAWLLIFVITASGGIFGADKKEVIQQVYENKESCQLALSKLKTTFYFNGQGECIPKGK